MSLHGRRLVGVDGASVSVALLPAAGCAGVPAPPDATGAGPSPLPVDALGVPDPHPARLDALFHRHAPVLEADVARPDDRPGAVMVVQRSGGTAAYASSPPARSLPPMYSRWRRWSRSATRRTRCASCFSSTPSA